MITLRRATPGDAVEFVELFLISSPYFPFLFGSGVNVALKDLFKRPSNLFSHQHVQIAEVAGSVAGMSLGYDWIVKSRENLRTGVLFSKNFGISMVFRIKDLLKFNATVGKFDIGEYYISNIATYPEFRGRGVGGSLIGNLERGAKILGAQKIVLDVEKENTGAINFYLHLRFYVVKKIIIPIDGDRILEFLRMSKDL